MCSGIIVRSFRNHIWVKRDFYLGYHPPTFLEMKTTHWDSIPPTLSYLSPSQNHISLILLGWWIPPSKRSLFVLKHENMVVKVCSCLFSFNTVRVLSSTLKPPTTNHQIHSYTYLTLLDSDLTKDTTTQASFGQEWCQTVGGSQGAQWRKGSPFRVGSTRSPGCWRSQRSQVIRMTSFLVGKSIPI